MCADAHHALGCGTHPALGEIAQRIGLEQAAVGAAPQRGEVRLQRSRRPVVDPGQLQLVRQQRRARIQVLRQHDIRLERLQPRPYAVYY